MNDDDYGRAIAPDTFQIRRLLPGPVERVWSYLIEPDKRKQWFAGGDLEPRAGGKVAFWFQHSNLALPGEPVPEKFKQPNEGMASEATVIRIEPPRLLSLQWGDGEVTFELESKGDKMLMTITHRKLRDRDEIVDVAGGWHKHLDVLGDVLRGERERRPFWAKVGELEAAYQQRIPAAPAPASSGASSSPTFKLVVTRRFAASAERVFDAFLDPAKAGQFMFATPTGKMIRAEIDPRVGGSFLFIDRRGDVDADHAGEYLEIARPRRLVFTFRSPASSTESSVVEIDIVPTAADACELTLTHTMDTKWQAMSDKVTSGWTTILDGAARTLAVEA